MSKVFINSFSQISVQKPFSEEWKSSPLSFDGQKLVRIQDPDFKEFLPSAVCRRNGKILKRAILVSNKALEASGLDSVDAVVTGTGLGCVENTEAFLQDLVHNGEEFLKPSLFMQSTHNTVSSTIGINLKCHGYNSTYCHNGVSFESALLDVFLQIQMGRINSAFVGGFDEMSQSYFQILEHQGYLGGDSKGFAGESACGCVVSTKKTDNTLCEISAVRMCNRVSADDLERELQHTLADAGIQMSDIDAIMTGINGKPDNDAVYCKNLEYWFADKPVLQYANIFGESYSGFVYGCYASAVSLRDGRIPDVLFVEKTDSNNLSPKNILLYHHFAERDHAFIVLRKC